MTTVDLLLPCLNESSAISWLASRIPRDVNVILCDNGSSDESRVLAREAGWSVTTQPNRRKVGAAILDGIRDSRAEIICVIDCDGTIDPADLGLLTGPIVRGEADVVVGDRTRYVDSRPLVHRVASSVRDAALLKIDSRWHLPDLGSARAFRRDAFTPDGYAQLSRGLDWNLDFTLAAIELLGPARVSAVDLPYHSRIGRSKISGSLTGLLAGLADTVQTLTRRYPTKRSAPA